MRSSEDKVNSPSSIAAEASSAITSLVVKGLYKKARWRRQTREANIQSTMTPR